MRCLPLNRSTLLVELAGLDEVLALQESLKRQPLEGIKEILPAARTLLLRFDPARLPRRMLAEALTQRELSGGLRTPGPLIEIPMRYDGEDLAEVARLTGLTVDEVIHRHGQSEFTVGFGGFSPGFAYLVGGDPVLHVPRRATPRARVAAGSVGLGGVYCGVYPQTSPGGWQIIGTTPISLWDPARDPPALLAPGTRVRFGDLARMTASTASPADIAASRGLSDRPLTDRGLPDRGLHLEVIAAMLPALIQDLGRPGHGDIGVTVSGALDRAALQAANHAVGNPEGLAGLEITLGSFALRCSGAMQIALAGAPAPLSVQRASGEIIEVPLEQSINLGPGDCVKLGYPSRGVRTYLAVGGGFSVPQLLGSASRDTLAALGPAPLVKGSILALAQAADSVTRRGIARPRTRTAAQGLPAYGDLVELDVFFGPRADWFEADSLEALFEQAWQVTPQSSRVGLRLRGEHPLQRCRREELPSEGVTRGAIQVPHDGQPVLLLADHPVTGGYPVIAVVAEHHLDLAGQIPPGARIRLRRIVLGD
jgi:KipI family sensor histidine kinase inhibitor